MLDLLLNLGMLVVLAIVLLGACIGFFLLGPLVGQEAAVFIGSMAAAYPAFFAFKKLEM